eukprot:CAMPEP_0118649218 /NCGR_PEP_ID=MMETSP0785-20121206/9584_1 /TAXON_ID=91992 /ORGANISM="Bolidomonas pacifica, Strain CCMP 1866" /LENGTH=230 /DNA_ID=CAMNT_0006541487 /DNA_START=74 /DNA_END=763 /DNA_ORIENTATION=-
MSDGSAVQRSNLTSLWKSIQSVLLADSPTDLNLHSSDYLKILGMSLASSMSFLPTQTIEDCCGRTIPSLLSSSDSLTIGWCKSCASQSERYGCLESDIREALVSREGDEAVERALMEAWWGICDYNCRKDEEKERLEVEYVRVIKVMSTTSSRVLLNEIILSTSPSIPLSCNYGLQVDSSYEYVYRVGSTVDDVWVYLECTVGGVTWGRGCRDGMIDLVRRVNGLEIERV